MAVKTKKRRYECLGGPLDGEKVRQGNKFTVMDRDMRMHYYGLVRLVSNDAAREMLFYHYYGTTLARAVEGKLRMIPRRAKFWPISDS